MLFGAQKKTMEKKVNENWKVIMKTNELCCFVIPPSKVDFYLPKIVGGHIEQSLQKYGQD